MNNLRTKIEDIKEEANEALRDKLQKGWNSTVARSRKTGKQIHSYAKENPWTLGAAALAIGFAAGYLLAGKERD